MKTPASKDVVAANVRRIRESKGLSQAELSRQASVSQPKLSLLEHARHDPKCETIDRLAEALDVTPADLLRPEKKSSQRS